MTSPNWTSNTRDSHGCSKPLCMAVSHHRPVPNRCLAADTFGLTKLNKPISSDKRPTTDVGICSSLGPWDALTRSCLRGRLRLNSVFKSIAIWLLGSWLCFAKSCLSKFMYTHTHLHMRVPRPGFKQSVGHVLHSLSTLVLFDLMIIQACTSYLP